MDYKIYNAFFMSHKEMNDWLDRMGDILSLINVQFLPTGSDAYPEHRYAVFYHSKES